MEVVDLLSDSEGEEVVEVKRHCPGLEGWPKFLGSRQVEAEGTFRGPAPGELCHGLDLSVTCGSSKTSIIRLNTPQGVEVGRLPRGLNSILAPVLGVGNGAVRCTAKLEFFPETFGVFSKFGIALGFYLANARGFDCFGKPDAAGDAELMDCLWKTVQLAIGELSVDGMFAVISLDEDEEEEGEVAKLDSGELIEEEPSQRLAVGLRPHQRQAVAWMKQREDSPRPITDTGVWQTKHLADGTAYYANPFTRVLSLSPPKPSHSTCRGGILADEMGLGKTVTVLDRIVQDLDENPLAQCTLIVVVTSLLAQWEQEIDTKIPTKRRVSKSTYYGSERALVKANIVLTTFGVVAAEFASSPSSSALFTTKWHRIVLDEAQSVRNGATLQTKAVLQLQSERKWALTGTPVSNGIEDLFQLFCFLRLEPWSERVWWERTIAKPFASAEQEESAAALQRLKSVLNNGPILLRRTHDTITDHAHALPPMQIELVWITLTAKEREFYDKLFAQSQTKFKSAVASNQPKSSFIGILALLTKLRQACDHPKLADAAYADEVSSKLDCLRQRVDALLAQDRTTKIVIFSQFMDMLDLVRRTIRVGQQRLDGSMSSAKRDQAVRLFREDASFPVLLMSLKAGGLGLNLTCANVVVLLDPWWSPAVESQAIGRLHRMGQTKPVTVLRFLAADTVDAKMLAIQDRKRKIATDTLGFDQFNNDDDEEDSSSPSGSHKLTLDDLKQFFT
ncbi:hypothetical protein BASA81_007436 [Batrachochytrium salamandrivorans]|nr:hypothetical protein BASA81_007436 [Batrachochytrium salamandrivorans]